MPSLLRKLEDLLNPYKGFFIKYNDILDATNHFHTTNIIQQVEKYNHVYRGKLIRFGTRINVIVEKRLNMTAEELLKLVSMISRFKHKNIATFVGFSYSLDLVYDAIADNCIAYIVSDGEVKESLSQSQNIVHVFSSSYNNFDYVYYKLTCSQRIQICMDAARALSYIHDCDAIHGDFRSTSVLLTEDLEVKVVCLVIIPENSTFSHYTDLDFSVTQKSDVYSFGVVLKDLFCQQYLNPSRSGNTANFRFYFDDDIREQLHSQAFLILSETIDRCLNAQHQRRPNMDETVKLLDKALFLQRRHENPKSIKIALDDIKSATQNFAETYQIGSVRYGKVYRAELYLFDENIFMETEENNPEEMYRMQSIVAIKHILYDEKDAEKGQDEKDIEKGQDELVFSLEIEMPRRYEHPKIVSLTGFSEEYVKMLRKFEHPNIVAFLGYCKENSEFILVYEFNPNGSLNDYLKSTKKEFYLNWVQRIRICVDIAQGLNYLQRCFMDEERKVYHDIKSANIFLGKNWEAKISDFGLSKYHHVNQLECTASTYTIASSEVYLDPEYLRTGKFEKKSDIYSLGVVFFEILSGRLAYDQIFLNENIKGIAAIAQKCFNEGTLEKIIDPKLFEETEELFFGLKIGVNQESLEVFAKIAFRCLTKSQDRPPTIKVIIKELQDALHIQEKRKEIIKFSIEDINLGTENFSDKNFIARQGLGILYRAEIPFGDGHKSVVLKVSRSREQHYFLNELEILFGLKHENVIEFVGYCKEMDKKIIVYENVSNWSTLDQHLNDTSLTWTKRLKICIDVANGLKFLHECRARKQLIIHRDIKSSNIVLDGAWNAKICGFEFSLKSAKNQETEVNNVVGSPGYCDPVYKITGFLTKESDIYSFGLVLFEMLCGKLACPKDLREYDEFHSLVEYYSRVGRLDEIVFEGIKGQIALESLATFQMIASQCLHEERKERPTADEVVVQLKKALELQESVNIGVLQDIKSATMNFAETYLIGSGGYGKVYKAELNLYGENLFLGIQGNNPEKMYMKRNTVAIKRICNDEKGHGEQGFFLEVEMLIRCKHPNIVSLIGYCNEHSELILVYEFVPNGSLDDYLGSIKKETYLNWVQRIKICLDMAHGLDYLHTNITDKERIIHRDIKSANILLGKNWEAKIADFGLSKFYPTNQLRSTMITNTIAGTDVYLDPEYQRTGKLKKESDIYSLGVVFFEILSGRLAYDPIYFVENIKGLAAVARKRFKDGTLKEIIDRKLLEEEEEELPFGLKIRANQESLEVFANIAFRCLAKTQEKRPSMKVVIKELENALNLQIAYQCLHEESKKRPTPDEVALELRKTLEFQVISENPPSFIPSRSLRDLSSIKKDLYLLKLEEGDDLNVHIDVFNQLVCELFNMDEIIKEEDLALLMLASLPKSYKPFVQNMRTDRTTTLKDVLQKLRNYN